MRLSLFHAPTLREAPKEAELPSHRLLMRAGFIRQLTAGIYDLLPLGVRTITRISNIIREEMNRAGAMEVLLPTVQPAELWEESGRWEKYGPELLRFQDRKANDYCLGPTHEEVIVDLVRRDIRSYKQLPVNLYQIQGKFRDEIRPRAGLMRGREFLMKDAYSFDVDVDAATRSYEAMYAAYERIFERCGLTFRAVEADSGNIGGSMSHEFQVLADTGEDAIVSCSSCHYTANVEKAGIGWGAPPERELPAGAPERVDTPDKRTVEEVTDFLGVAATDLIKTLILDVDGEHVAAMVRGDRELNPLKVKTLLGAASAELAEDAPVIAITGAPVGFAGPVGLGIPLVADPEVMAMDEAVCGANAADSHLRKVVPGRDFAPAHVADIRMATGGDPCPKCGEALRSFRGIEVGHVFYLGTKYSEPMGCTFLDADGKSHPMVMGCYGIGVTRIMAAAVEQGHDDRGITWPVALAPFELAIAPLGKPGDALFEAGEKLYAEAMDARLDVLFDDRKERPGVKLADLELIGVPYQLIIGKRNLAEGKVELKRRSDGQVELVDLDQAIAHAKRLIDEAR